MFSSHVQMAMFSTMDSQMMLHTPPCPPAGRQNQRPFLRELYKKLIPAYMSQKWSEHTVEPYVYASYTNTAPSGQLGRTGIPWNSGTVCWMLFRLRSQYKPLMMTPV